MEKLGFDPGAEVEFGGGRLLAEVIMDRAEDGRFLLTVVEDNGAILISLALRADFLDTVLAQARTSEAAA